MRTERKVVKLLPTQFAVMKSKKREVLYSGGYGCISGSTKLLTKEGEIAIKDLVRDNKAPTVLTWTGKDFEWIQAEIPYLKSYEDTLQIKTSDGKSVVVAKNHVFLTATGWKFASACVVGELLLGYSACPQCSGQDISDLSSYNSPYLSTSIIQEINQTRHNKIYDIGVPVYHNYVAHGLIHHNSGKSIVGSWFALRETSIPNNRVLVLRKTVASLKKSTLNTLLSILPDNSYQFNKTESVIKFYNGSEIYLMAGEDPERIKSTEFGGAFIDEASELTEEEYQVIKYRIRLKHGSRRILLTTNPSSQSHWLYKRFYEEQNKYREAFTASSSENRFLPKDYLQELNGLQGARFDRCVNGLWVNMDSMVFDTFDRKIHVKHIEDCGYEDYVIAIDYGYNHYTGILVVGLSGNRMFAIEEYYQNHKLVREIIEAVKELGKKYPNATYVYDPSAAGMGAELENLDLRVLKANNDVAQGIDRIRNRLKVTDYGCDLVISDKCVNLIREMENYQYVSGTEKPVKKNDDLVDPLRYATNYVDDMKNSYIFPKFMGIDKEEEEWVDLFDDAEAGRMWQ